MPNGAWTEEENDLIVADYFAMLADDMAGRPYNKAEHRRGLMPRLANRSESSIEFKHQNISAVLKGLGEGWIPGYMPAFNFQMALVDAVARWLAINPARLVEIPSARRVTGLQQTVPLWVGPPPTLSNQPRPQELEQMLRIAAKFDVAGRDDLARKVRWVSEEDGDGAGYDIASFAPDGQERLIEVKTTNGWERTPFYLTRNELAVAEARRTEWCLFRLWNFLREPKAFELRPPLDAHVSLTATTFEASFH